MKDLLNLSYLFILLFSACDYYDNKLVIVNNSSDSMFFICMEDTIFTPIDSSYVSSYFYHKIPPYQKERKTIESTNGWNAFIANSNNSMLNVFCIPLDSINSFKDWERNRLNGNYKRISLTEKELEQSNWVIEYK